MRTHKKITWSWTTKLPHCHAIVDVIYLINLFFVCFWVLFLTTIIKAEVQIRLLTLVEKTISPYDPFSSFSSLLVLFRKMKIWTTMTTTPLATSTAFSRHRDQWKVAQTQTNVTHQLSKCNLSVFPNIFTPYICLIYKVN